MIWSAALAAGAMVQAAGAASGNLLLIRRGHPVQLVEVAEIGARRLVYRDESSGWIRAPLHECVGLLDPDARQMTRHLGWLNLADGQRFPGEALSGAKVADDVLVWDQSSWMGRMEVPLDRIESVTFIDGAVVPPMGDADVLLLANGDEITGFVQALGDPISIELLNGGPDGATSIDLPLSRVASVRMVTPPQRPVGRRLWLADGTVVDVPEILLGDDGYVRLGTIPLAADQQPRSVELSGVMAILFDQEGLVPFASMRSAGVNGPATRYIVPHPRVLDEMAPLGLSRVEFRGPVSVRYALPNGASLFWADAELPIAARSWGDCEVLIRDDDRQIFSTRLNAQHPTASIAAALTGSALTVEIIEASSGPIQDQVVLRNAFVLVEK